MKTLILATLALSLCACSDLWFGRDFEGEVVKVSSRFSRTGTNGGEEKISLLVKPGVNIDSKIEDVACGPSGCAIECLSTRCASIIDGTCHHFECKYVFGMTDPDIIACKHLKEVECR